MNTILGIDPGSRKTGYGLIEVRGDRLIYIDSGCIRCGEGEFIPRLQTIFNGIRQIVEHYTPTVGVVERLFMYKNPDSALKLGQARGAAITALLDSGVEVHEYTPAEVKKAVVGKGNAAKHQVQHMVTAILELSATPQEDAADALAIAMCHAQTRTLMGHLALASVTGRRRGRFR